MTKISKGHFEEYEHKYCQDCRWWIKMSLALSYNPGPVTETLLGRCTNPVSDHYGHIIMPGHPACHYIQLERRRCENRAPIDQ